MDLFPQVIKNTFVQVLGRIGVILITLVTTAILTRFLGTQGYGNYVFILAFIMLLVTVSDWGTGMISVREAAKGEKEEEKIYGSVLWVRFLLASIAFLFTNLLVYLVPSLKVLQNAFVLASFLILFLSMRTSLGVVFQTKLHFEYQVVVELVSSSLFLLGLWVCFYFWVSLETVFLALTLSSMVASSLAFVLARRLTSFDFALNKTVFKRIFWESLPTGFLLILFSVYNRIDIIILQFLKGAEPVGVYGLAYKVHENLILGAAYLMSALFPIMSRHARDNQEMIKIYRKTFDVLFLAVVPLSLLCFLLAPLVIAIIGGANFSQSALALRILVFATPFAYFNHLTGYSLVALGKQRVSLVIALAALFWNLFLNFIFIPRFSFLGAAWVTVATEGLVFVLTSYYLAKKFGLYPSTTFLRTLKEIIKTRGKIF